MAIMRHLKLLGQSSLANSAQQIDSQTWTDELKSVGRVEFPAGFRRTNWWYLVLVFVFLIFMMWAGYTAGRFTGLQALGSIVVVLGSILALLLWPRIKYSGKSMIVEQDSIRFMEGQRFHWSEIIRVGANRSSKSGPSIVFQVTESAWERYLRQAGFWSGMNHRLIHLIERKRALYIAAYFDFNQAEFIAWLNGFAQGQECTGED